VRALLSADGGADKLQPMPTTAYNRLSGQSLERIAALSDGVFAVAMTLLVLDLHAPAAEAIHSEGDLRQKLLPLLPRLLAYMMSFLTLGIFWVGQQTQLNHFERSDRNLAWVHLGFLFAVTLLPFTTSLLAEFIEYRTALLLYWLNIVLLGAMLIGSWLYASRSELVKLDAPPDLNRLILGRVLVAQSLYAAGAALCFFSTYLSIGFIVLIQLNYAIAPRMSKLLRY
jgi:uncharacterized membrane protein